ncbi:MAG: methyl-accepting chemotaxis protein, partial [Candidatus Micrarchaeaceae archaeon]
SITEYFFPALYVSVPNPQSPGFYFSPVAVAGYYLPVYSPLTAAVFDFPAGVSVSVYLGSTLIGSVTTDSNGFGILPVTTTIPAIPAGTYAATAVDSSQGIVASPTIGPTSISITPFWMATDPLGNLLFLNEFVPQNGTIMFTAYGLAPSIPFYIFDEAIGNVAISGTNVTVSVGSVSPLGFFVPADNGTLIMSYQPFYGYYGIITGTKDYLGTYPGMLNLAGILIPDSFPGYLEIGAPILSVSPSTSATGASAAITFNNLIYSITLSPAVPYQTFYPGTSGFYNFYIGTTKIVSSGVSVFTSSSSPITFTVPSLASGLYNISVTYDGQPLSDALPVNNTATAMLVVSTPGKSTSSGTIVTVPTYSAGLFSGYAIAGYGLIPSTPADLVIYNSEGPHTSTSIISTGTDGAFLDTSDLTATGPIYSNSAAGTWGIVLTVAPSTASAFEFYSSYKVTATFLPGIPFNGVFILGEVEHSVNFIATGLMPVTNYVIEFNGTVLTSPTTGLPIPYTSNSNGIVSGNFTVPIVYVSESVGHSVYNVSIAPLSSPSTPAVTVSGLVMWPSTITILPDPQAFPNELVNFVWTPSTEPNITSTIPTPIYVTVYLSGSAYETVLGTFNYVSSYPNASYITGSFKMPNGMPNTVFAVSFGWSTTSVSGSAVSSGSVLTLSPSSYTGTSDATLKLISAAGAQVVSVSTADIASIITSSINSALAIPLSELSANITALHGDIVTITTAFGTMTATLQAINATVSSIESGQALIKTDLGTISTTLSSINASIVSLNNNVVTINTTLGKVTTSLSSINATVTSTASGVSSLQGSAVTIITDLGTITGVVTNISNGIATIQTSLGNLTRNVSQIKTSTGKINTISSSLGTTEIFEIVILVLVLITLVLSFLAINAANRVAKKVEEQKKQ